MEGGPTISHPGISRRKKREPTAPAANTVLPMELQVDDRLADKTGEWEVVGRPFTTAAGQMLMPALREVGKPEATDLKTLNTSA